MSFLFFYLGTVQWVLQRRFWCIASHGATIFTWRSRDRRTNEERERCPFEGSTCSRSSRNSFFARPRGRWGGEGWLLSLHNEESLLGRLILRRAFLLCMRLHCAACSLVIFVENLSSLIWSTAYTIIFILIWKIISALERRVISYAWIFFLSAFLEKSKQSLFIVIESSTL